jgi:photosystem II stability/assembly factor-like uncharacterized protein
MRAAALLLALTLTAHAQWDSIDAHTTADLRGVSAPTPGIAWISGNNGTILRTEDGGYLWQHCTTPPNAEHLDFRGIQAFDANTAIVMSSGKGDLSRLYKTTDGCQSWTLLFTNPDPEGFWDAIVVHGGSGLLIGDPVQNRFQIYGTEDAALEKWERIGETSSLHEFRFDLDAYPGESLFAASNSILLGSPTQGVIFASGGPLGSRFSLASWQRRTPDGGASYMSFKSSIPLAKGNTSGAFSLGAANQSMKHFGQLVAVGGNYAMPSESNGTSAWSKDGGQHWKVSKTSPHGYRSAVAYDSKTTTWITVGPNGTDISTDDGRNWHSIHPTPGEPADADRNWNALALPFVVGPHGHVGILNPSAFKPPTK